MTTQQAASQGFPTIRPATLSRLAAFAGPCVTLTLPGRHPGAPEASPRVQAKGLLDAALAGHTDAAWAGKARKAVEDFLTNSVPAGGAPGLAILANENGVECFQSAIASAHAAAGQTPHIVSLLEPAAVAQELWILALSTKHLKLFEYADGAASAVPLPATVPANLDAAGHFHTGTVPGQGRSGGPGGVPFGRSGERESAHDSIEHYCAMIDHGLHSVLAGRPLLLMGVKEEIAAYRRVSHYDSLLAAEVDGNVEYLTPAQIAEKAQAAARDEYLRLGQAILAEFREMRDRARALDDPHAVLEAAVAGRVHNVCVRAGTELAGPGGDVLNAIAVETIRKGGMAYVLPQQDMPVTQTVCAILRY
ncbi:MAG: hypothetical protein RL328_1331 [Acidobacteriota bacterium]